MVSNYYDNIANYNQSVYANTSTGLLHHTKKRAGLGVAYFDKFVIILFIILSIMLLATLVSKYVFATQLSYQKQELIIQTVAVVESNREIEIDLARLASSERIYNIAVNELGMIPADANNIKVVSRVVTAGIENAGVANNGSFQN